MTTLQALGVVKGGGEWRQTPRDVRLLVVCCPLLARFWESSLLKATCEICPSLKSLSQDLIGDCFQSTEGNPGMH